MFRSSRWKAKEGQSIMISKRFWKVALVLGLTLALMPRGAQATPPISGDTISFGVGNDVGASTADVNSVALGDLDGDGDLDIVSGSSLDEDNEIIVWQNDGTPFSGLWATNDVGTTDPRAVDSVALGDLDNDGDLDIVSGSSFSATYYELVVWENDGSPFTGTWTQNNAGDSSAGVNSVALGDLDDDGNLDIVSGGGEDEDYEIIVWRNDGSPFSGLWTGNDVGASADTVYSVKLGDLDHDGDLDIVSGSGWEQTHQVIAWQNDGSPFSGTWTSNNVGLAGDDVWSVALGDLDNDGDLDVISGNASATGWEASGWQNDGSPFSGTWTRSEVGHSDGNVYAVAVGDLDNDGDMDVVTGSDTREEYEIIACQNTLVHRNMPFNPVGNGAGTSANHVRSVALGDLDGDGDLDVVSGSTAGDDHEIIAWQNDGTPFSGAWTQNDVGASTSVYSVALGDLDGDGDLDLVSGDIGGGVYAWNNDGTPFSGTWTQNNVGTSADRVKSVALGDLDNDGDLDVVTGSESDEDYEVIVWQNDGSPFSGAWTPNNVGASADRVDSVALGDLDNDGDLDIASGSGLYEDYEVIVWQNDGSPFSGTWTPNNVGASTGFVTSVALGDLDNDGDLDIALGNSTYDVVTWHNDGSPFSGLWTQNDMYATDLIQSVALGDLDRDGDLDLVSGSNTGADYELIAWQNDGTPFSGLWTQNGVGTSAGNVLAVSLGDLDNDGDLDLVSGSNTDADYEVMAWQNIGGAVTEDTTATSPAEIASGQTDDLLRVVVTHNGISGDNDLELAQWNLLFEESDGDPLSSAEANNLVENLYFYYSADNSWEPTDTVVTATATLSLNSGVQTVVFTDGDTNVQVPATTSRTYFVVVELTADAYDQTPNSFQVTFDPDADSLVENPEENPEEEDASVSIEDTDPASTGTVEAGEWWYIHLPLVLRNYGA